MRHYVIRGYVEQPTPGAFRAFAWADPVESDVTGDPAESVESRALDHEHARRLLTGLATTLAAAIRLRGDTVDAIEIGGNGASAASGSA